jgi:hypothetical protein
MVWQACNTRVMLIDTGIQEFCSLKQQDQADLCMQEEETSPSSSSFSPVRNGKLNLEKWESNASAELYTDLFTQSAKYLSHQYKWPLEQASHFDSNERLSYHYACQRVNLLTHKTHFSMKDARVKLACVERAKMTISRVNQGEEEEEEGGEDGVGWSLLVSNCRIQILEPERCTGLTVYMPKQKEPIQLDAASFSSVSSSGRSLNLNHLAGNNHWCLLRSVDAIQVIFDGPLPGIFVLSTPGHCSLHVSSGFLEFWTNITTDFPLNRVVPYQFSVQNAKFFYRIYCHMTKRLEGGGGGATGEEILGDLQLSDDCQFHESHSYIENMARFRILMDIEVYFFDIRTPYFYYKNSQLPSQWLHDDTIVIYYRDQSLAHIRIDYATQFMYFMLIAQESTVRGNLLSYHVY